MARSLPLDPDERLNWRTSLPFLAFHLAPLAIILTGVSTRAVVLCVSLYFARMFIITAGYHRYFSHRSYRAGRPVQFALALGGTMAVQKGPLWWAANHRSHHRYADTERDPHSPLKGFWYSHVGWILADRHSGTDLGLVSDLARYPELRWIDRHNWIGPWALAIATFIVGGWSGLVVGFFLSTILLWHGTFLVNSMAHIFGRRRYATSDTSRNSLLIALFTMGEGWHNNHHHYQSSARQGFFWWELDPTWYGLRLMSALHLVSDLRHPPAAVLASPRTRNGAFDVGMFRNYWVKASAALAASKATIGDTASESVAAISESVAAIEAKLQAERIALEASVASSMKVAEAYATLLRHGGRRPRTVE